MVISNVNIGQNNIFVVLKTGGTKFSFTNTQRMGLNSFTN
jgi:hypothetical protein